MSSKYKIKITDEFFNHRYAEAVVRQEKELVINFKDLFNDATINLEPTQRSAKKGAITWKGINAKDLNVRLRELLKANKDIDYEVYQVDGIYYSSKQTNGFDFAILDKKNNFYNLRNLCFGERQYVDGEKRFKDFIVKNPSYKKYLSDNKKLDDLSTYGIDLYIERERSIILGEIQFGNWGLFYSDFSKILDAKTLTDVDLLIYITDGDMEGNLLSSGIVTFEKVKKHLIEFKKTISTPVWVIGLGLEKQ